MKSKANQNNNLDKFVVLANGINLLEQKMDIILKEKYAVESELYEQILDNRNLLNAYKGESEITIVQPEFTLLNCKSTQNKKISCCAMFRSKNIVYLTLIFEGKIEEKQGKAGITFEMPMWKINAGTFKIESLSKCLSREENINKLCIKLKQTGNEVNLSIQKNEFDVQTYWDNSDNAKFTIRGNFFIEPIPIRSTGKFYIYNIASSKVISVNKGELVLSNNWKAGYLFEIYKEKGEMRIKANNKYLNNDNGSIKLVSKTIENEIVYMPGFSDIIYILLNINNINTYISSEDEGNKLILENEPNTKCQFMIIPELK